MARIADEDDAVMQQFFGGGGGGGQQRMDPMTLAMQILEMGRKGREFGAESGLKREEQQALNKYRQDVLAQEGRKQASEIGLADIQKRALLDEIAGRRTEAGAKRKFEEAQLGNERLKTRVDAAKTMMADTSIPIADRMKMWGELDPGIKNMLDVGAEAANKTRAQALIPGLQTGYAKGDPKLIAAAIAGQPQEILQRPEIDWQKLAQGWGGEQGANVAGMGQGAGLAGTLWNAPGAAQNVGKGIVGGLLNLVMGEENAPKIAPTMYTNPLRQAPQTAANVGGFLENTLGQVGGREGLAGYMMGAGPMEATAPWMSPPQAVNVRRLPSPQTVGAATTPGADILQRLFGPEQGQ